MFRKFQFRLLKVSVQVNYSSMFFCSVREITTNVKKIFAGIIFFIFLQSETSVIVPWCNWQHI